MICTCAAPLVSVLRRRVLWISIVVITFALLALPLGVLLRLWLFPWHEFTFRDDPSYRGVAAGHAPGEGPMHHIPAIMHQTYKHADFGRMPATWSQAHAACKSLNPTYRHLFWTDETARAFMVANYPEHVPNYDAYPHAIQRVDAARYFILFHFGGIYLDLDVECRKPLDAVRLHFGAILPATRPFGVRCARDCQCYVAPQ